MRRCCLHAATIVSFCVQYGHERSSLTVHPIEFSAAIFQMRYAHNRKDT